MRVRARERAPVLRSAATRPVVSNERAGALQYPRDQPGSGGIGSLFRSGLRVDVPDEGVDDEAVVLTGGAEERRAGMPRSGSANWWVAA